MQRNFARLRELLCRAPRGDALEKPSRLQRAGDKPKSIGTRSSPSKHTALDGRSAAAPRSPRRAAALAQAAKDFRLRYERPVPRGRAKLFICKIFDVIARCP